LHRHDALPIWGATIAFLESDRPDGSGAGDPYGDPYGDASIAPIAGAGRSLRHERNRPQPTDPDECNADVGVVRIDPLATRARDRFRERGVFA
jgi:hypothetical protein